MFMKFSSNLLKLLTQKRYDSRQLCLRTFQSKSISEILHLTDFAESSISASGWIKSVRHYKDVVFIHVSDGSCFQPLQVVLTPDKLPSDASFGSCIAVKGNLVTSRGGKQAVEVLAEEIKVLGKCDPEEYPFHYKERHPLDYQRQFLHLRNRQPFFTSLLRIRNAVTQAMHQYFQSNGFIQIPTPVLTSNDCEGAGEVFQVEPANKRLVAEMDETDDSQSDEAKQLNKNQTDNVEQFFNRPAYLTVSGQLHLEAMTGSLSKVYTMSPAFRAENARSRHHLCEFCMVEAELAFTNTLEDICTVIEDLIKFTTTTVLSQSEEDINFFQKFVAPKGHSEKLQKVVEKPFVRLEYTEAVNLLERHRKNFKFEPKWGCDLQKEHEKWLVSYCENQPVFVVNFPAELKPFYARQNEDPNTVCAVDLLFPEVGEVCGGSLREERYDRLQSKLAKEDLEKSYHWYLDLRKFGTAPHGGFGLGLERYIQAILGIKNIKDTLPFPRYERNCKL